MSSLLLKLAWKNLWRRSGRTLLVVLMISISLSVMLMIEGLYDGMLTHRIADTVRAETGSVSVMAKGYRLNRTLKYRIADADTLIKKIAQMPGVTGVRKRLQVTGLISTAHKSRMGVLCGIDFNAEKALGRLDGYMVSGTFEAAKRTGIAGKQLADRLDIGLGKRIVFSAQDATGEIGGLSVRLNGVIQTSAVAIDARTIFVPVASARTFAAVEPAAATMLLVDTLPGREAAVKAVLTQQLGTGYEVLTLREYYPALEQMQEMMGVFNAITFVIVMTVVLIGVMGVMFVSILERTRELAVLRALGMQFSHLRLQILFEAALMGLMGFVAGAVLGAAGLWYLKTYGFDLGIFEAGLAEFGYASVLYAEIRPEYFTTTMAAIAVAVVLSILFPLRRLRKKHLAEVIKEET